MFAVPSACDACLGSQQMFAVLDFQIPLDLAMLAFRVACFVATFHFIVRV